MIKLILVILFTSLAVILGPLLADSQGFVHIATNSRIIETSITTAIVIYILSVFIIFAVYAILKKIYLVPKGTLRAFKLRANKKKLSQQDEAEIYFEQGEYEKALSLFKHINSIKKMSEKSLLTAAQCAFHIGLYDYTRQALDEAEKRGKNVKLAAEVIRARLNLDIGNPKASLEFLEATKGNISNASVLHMFVKCYSELGLTDKIVAMSKELVNNNVLSDEEARKYYLKNIQEKLSKASTIDEVDNCFKDLTKYDKKEPKIISAFIYKMIKLGDVNHAKTLSLSLLKQDPDPFFLDSVSTWEIAIPDVLVSLKKYAAKNMITTQVNLPLLKAMANLEYKSGLLRDALADYKQALSIEQSPDLYIRVGTILTGLQNYPEATEYFARANSLYSEEKSLALVSK